MSLIIAMFEMCDYKFALNFGAELWFLFLFNFV